MSGEPVIPPNSRAILIGVPHYQDPAYSSYTAVGNSVNGMFQLLVESDVCGWRKEQVTRIIDPANAGQLMGRLRELAQHTTGVLLLYFVGHGQPSEHNGDLCLAIVDTDHANPDATGLEYTKIKKMLYDGTPAATKIAILDCCYSGRAIGLGADDDATQLAELSDCAGAYTLTAADERAHVPPNDQGNPRTALTGELLDLLTRDGIPDGPPGLTLGEIFPRLRQRLAAKGLPRPNQRSDDAAAAFVFARNRTMIANASEAPASQDARRVADTKTGASALPVMSSGGQPNGPAVRRRSSRRRALVAMTTVIAVGFSAVVGVAVSEALRNYRSGSASSTQTRTTTNAGTAAVTTTTPRSTTPTKIAPAVPVGCEDEVYDDLTAVLAQVKPGDDPGAYAKIFDDTATMIDDVAARATDVSVRSALQNVAADFRAAGYYLWAHDKPGFLRVQAAMYDDLKALEAACGIP